VWVADYERATCQEDRPTQVCASAVRAVTVLPPADTAARDQAWAARKAAYRETVPYGCRRCLKAGLRGDPEQWLDCHHVWGNGRIWDTGAEPDHALMWLCQPHHDTLTRDHARFCRKLRVMHGNDIRHPMLYSVTLGVWTFLYVLTGRVLLTAPARAGLYAAGVYLGVRYGAAALCLLLIWPALLLWRSSR
jgi:hypothetical protein